MRPGPSSRQLACRGRAVAWRQRAAPRGRVVRRVSVAQPQATHPLGDRIRGAVQQLRQDRRFKAACIRRTSSSTAVQRWPERDASGTSSLRALSTACGVRRAPGRSTRPPDPFLPQGFAGRRSARSRSPARSRRARRRLRRAASADARAGGAGRASGHAVVSNQRNGSAPGRAPRRSHILIGRGRGHGED